MIKFCNYEILRVILSLHIHVGYLDWIGVVGKCSFHIEVYSPENQVEQNNVERRTFLSW